MSSPVTQDPHLNSKGQGLMLAALGVVFGDIGTSPLYTLKECFGHSYGLEPTSGNILGILSLIIWAVIVVVSMKYVVFIMRADNKGEGGIMALMSLVVQKAKISPKAQSGLMILGLVGASLFYGDGIITPAISVMSAVEGLEVLKPELHHYIIPISLIVLIALFATQRHGTSKVGGLFGPVMVIWFVSLGVFGIMSMIKTPEVIGAFNPLHGFLFFKSHGSQAFVALAGVVLAITGGEALYADMGHFGRSPISRAWFFVALPGLLLNYLGQSALMMREPSAVENPFYLLIPAPQLSFMIILATLATVIASQAVISGAFSLTAQAIQLGFSPRLKIDHTSEGEMGQIYLPAINWALMVGVIILIVGFKSSSALAGAYGIAVTGTMVTTTILASVVFHRLWKWNLVLTFSMALVFLLVDLAFLGANALKIVDGGWFPLIVGTLVFILLTTWKYGRKLLLERLHEVSLPVAEFLELIESHPPVRVNGTAVFMAGNPTGIPLALLLNLRHNKVLHENVIIMTVITEPVPRVLSEKRRVVRKLADGLFRVNLHYGFMESPNIPKALKTCSREIDIDPKDLIFFIGRETLTLKSSARMALWRIKLFITMAKNTGSAAQYFQIPFERVVEMGTQVSL